MPSHLLIISDLHIGEYVKDVDRIGYIKGFSRRDESICAFLEYHQSRWIDDTPWRLIINGDFIDFIAVTLRPADSTQNATPELRMNDEESAWGLDSSPEKVVWKLGRIVERHRMLFAYLADFVGKGNSLEILYGNHDVEFWWPEVHAAFEEHLRKIYFGGEASSGSDEESFVSRIKFHQWFIYEPGRLYIEHGNQYDDFSSFEYRLNPVAPFDKTQLAMPVSHMAIRYFVNKYKGFRSHNKDNWTPIDYFRWLGEQGLDNTVEVFRLCFKLAGQIVLYARVSRASTDTELAGPHIKRLEDLARDNGLDIEVMRRLDAMRNEPVTESFGRTVQTVGLDLQALAILWFGLAFVVLAIPFSWSVTLGLWSTILLLAVATHWLMPKIRERYLGGRVTTAVEPKLDDAAVRIARLLGVRYVIFGHTHKPKKVQVNTQPSSWYVNTGSWLAPRQRERHRGGCPSRLTFVVFRDGAVPEARLFRWCARDNRPVLFNPKVKLQTLDPEEVGRQNQSDQSHSHSGLRSKEKSRPELRGERT